MNRNAETNRDILRRTAALLFALADLADRASLAPSPVRALALAILRYAEAVVQALVLGMLRDLDVAMPLQASLDGDDPDDTTRLAFRLRVLALVLADLSALVARSGHGSGRIAIVATIEMPRSQLARCRGKSAPTPDTS